MSVREALLKKHTADERLELAILRQPEKKRLELLELARPQALREWVCVCTTKFDGVELK